MKNKILAKIYMPQIDENFEIFLPLNKNISNIITLICKSVSEIKRVSLPDSNDYFLYNMDTGLKYEQNKTIKETNIRNGTRLLIM